MVVYVCDKSDSHAVYVRLYVLWLYMRQNGGKSYLDGAIQSDSNAVYVRLYVPWLYMRQKGGKSFLEGAIQSDSYAVYVVV